MSKAFSQIGAAIASAFTVKALIEFGKVCVRAASDVEEMENKFNVVFQGMTDEVDAWAANYSNAIGRNKNTIKEFLADNQNMFVGMGMTRTAAAGLSEDLVTLGLDLASFNNIDEAQAVNALSKALMGESEAAKTLGAVLNENTIAMAMNQMGIKGRFDALSEAQKMEVRYQAVLMQSTDAVGDCERSVDSLKGSQIRLKSAAENLMQSIGSKLLPVVSSFVSMAANGAQFVNQHLDDLVFIVGELSAIMITRLAGTAITSVVAGFQAAQVQLALYAMENGTVALSQGALTGALSLTEVAVGVLTGQISIATGVQTAWNAVLSANPIGLVVAGVAALGIAYKKLSDYNKRGIAEMVGQAESTEEAAATVERLKNRIQELEATDPTLWSAKTQMEYNQLYPALEEAQKKYEEFKEAEEAAAMAAEEPSARFQAATDEYVQSAEALMTKFQDTYNSILGNIEGWFKPFETVSINVQTSIADMIAGMQSQIEFNNKYADNLDYLKEQGLGGLADAFQEYGAEGAAYAETVAEALRQAGGASSEEGQKIIQNLTETYSTLETTQGELANSLTLANGKIEAEMEDLTANYAEKIADLDMSAEALTNAQNTMSSFLAGISKGKSSILSAMSNLGSQMTRALQSSLGSVTITVNGTFNESGVPKLATGLDYVPYDEFPAVLHKGEAVLTASEASAWRAGKESTKAQTSGSDQNHGAGITIIQNIQAIAQTPVEIAAATEAYFQNARWAMA